MLNEILAAQQTAAAQQANTEKLHDHIAAQHNDLCRDYDRLLVQRQEAASALREAVAQRSTSEMTAASLGQRRKHGVALHALTALHARSGRHHVHGTSLAKHVLHIAGRPPHTCVLTPSHVVQFCGRCVHCANPPQ